MFLTILERAGPVIEIYNIEGSTDHRVVVAYRQGSSKGFFSSLSDLYHYYGLTSSRKYVGKMNNNRFQRTKNNLMATNRTILEWHNRHFHVFTASERNQYDKPASSDRSFNQPNYERNLVALLHTSKQTSSTFCHGSAQSTGDHIRPLLLGFHWTFSKPSR